MKDKIGTSININNGFPAIWIINHRHFFFFFKPFAVSLHGFPVGTVVNNLPANTGDPRVVGSIPGWGRSPGR